MAESPSSPSNLKDLILVVLFTTLVMTLGSMAILWVPAIAPAIAEDIGVSASLVGYQFSISYVGAMVASLMIGGAVQRFGAWRSSQSSLALFAAGHLVIMSGNVPLIIVGSFLVGLGYGMINPAALDLLNRVVSPQNRNLVFSIRFIGVPLGGVLASLIGPSLALAVGWKSTMLLVGAGGAVLFVVMQAFREKFDRTRDQSATLFNDPRASLSLVFRHPALKHIAVMGLCFAGVQLSLMSILVTLLVEEAGWDLVSAGIALSVVQVAGVLGRPSWGLVADRVGSSTLVLTGLGAAMTLCAILAIGIDGSWTGPLTYIYFFLFGICAVGWNGVFASETARVAPEGRISHAAGGVMFVTFAGVLAGPTVFSAAHAQTGGYASTFIVTAILAAIGAVSAWNAGRAAKKMTKTT